MKYTATIEIPKEELDYCRKLLSFGEVELIENGIPPLENLKTWTARFSNGIEVDIKLNSSEDDIWSEGVLFDTNGSEISHTDVCDFILGEWSFDFNGDEYIFNVKES